MQPRDVFIDQNTSDLCLTIVDGELDMSQFHQLSAERIRLGEYTLTATIIGASHVIGVSDTAGTPFFHEILACVQPKVNSVQRTWPVEEIPTPVPLTTAALSYTFASYAILPWTDEYATYVDEVVASSVSPVDNGIRIAYEFPQDSLPAKPATIVTISTKSLRQAQIQTIHSYPTKGVVLSSSTISV